MKGQSYDDDDDYSSSDDEIDERKMRPSVKRDEPAFVSMLEGEDPDTINAVADAVISSPDAREFVEEAYDAVVQVQEMCDVDFDTICGSEYVLSPDDLDAFTNLLLNANQQITPFSMMHTQFRRNLRAPFVQFGKKEKENKEKQLAHEQGNHKNQVGLLGKLKELLPFHRGLEHEHHRKVMERLDHQGKGDEVEAADGFIHFEMSVDDGHHGNSGGSNDDDFDDSVEVVNIIAFPEQHPTQPMPPFFNFPAGPGPHLGGVGPAPRGRNHRVHGRSQNQFTATSYGYGSAGDQCIFDNFSQFSAPCQDAIQALDDLHVSIVSEQVDDYHHHHRHHHPILVLLILSVVGYMFYRRHQKMRSIRQILNVIDANPSLKEQVEQLAGVPIPPHNSVLASGCTAASCAFKSVGMVALFFVTFFFVVVSSAIMTGILLNKHHHHNKGGNHDDDDGIAAVVIFGAIAAIEVAIIRKFVWSRITNFCGCTQEIDYTERAARAAAGGDAGISYAPLSNNSTHMSELTAYPISTGTTGTAPMVREVRPSSQLTML